jgi:ABC-type Na+ transport system ATPase subunit NatA
MRNGAGKSTTMRVVVGLDALDAGNRITLRTAAPADAMTVLAGAGAQVTLAGSGVLSAAGVSSETAFVPYLFALLGALVLKTRDAWGQLMPSFSAASLVPSTRFLIFWNATSLA